MFEVVLRDNTIPIVCNNIRKIHGFALMYVLENYDIAFSRDPAAPDAGEVALLVVERGDLPPLEGKPSKAFLIKGAPQMGTEELRQLHVDFVERAGPPRTQSSVNQQLCLNLPLAVYDLLAPLGTIWLCEVDEGQVVSEHKLDLYKQSQ